MPPVRALLAQTAAISPLSTISLCRVQYKSTDYSLITKLLYRPTLSFSLLSSIAIAIGN